jgi:hypothetical protein
MVVFLVTFYPISPPVHMANILALFEHTAECPTWAWKILLLVEQELLATSKAAGGLFVETPFRCEEEI